MKPTGDEPIGHGEARLLLKSRTGWCVLLFLAGFAELAASAATYNFYFNNSEQGDHGTVTPSVTVQSGAPAAVPGSAAPAPAAAPPVVVAIPVEQGASRPATAAAIAIAPPFRHWRLTGGVQDSLGGVGPLGGIGYFFNQDFGIQLYGGFLGNDLASPAGAGLFLGTELEFSPIHLKLGRFADAVELGALLGVSTIAAESDNWVSPHVGARLSFNAGHDWGLTTAVRANASYLLFEMGLVARL
jgi:hypothetical protein